MLLKGWVSVNCHKHTELCGTEPEQLSILDTGQASLRNRQHLMAFNFFGQSMVDALVQVSDGLCRIFNGYQRGRSERGDDAYSVR